MKRKLIISLLGLILFITACGLKQEESSPMREVQQIVQKQVPSSQAAGNNQEQGASSEQLKLEIAQEANDIAMQTRGVRHVSSVALNKDLSVAVEVGQMQRWHLERIRKDIFRELTDKYPDLDIHVSTDRKILWELQKLEKDMYASNPNIVAIQKKLKKVNEDMKG